MEYMSSLIAVKDMAASRKFYTGLFEMQVTFDLEVNVVLDGKLALQTLDTWADFCDTTPASIRFGGGASELYFETEDFDAFMEKLERDWSQVKVVCGVKEFPWGQRSIKLADPDDHYVEVGENMKTVTKRFLRQGLSEEDTQKRVQYPIEFVQMCRAELEKEG